MIALLTQAINLFAAILLILAFAMITQRRVLNLVHLFTAQGLTLVAATLDVGYLTAQHHLYVSAGATFLLKVVLLPILLHKLIDRLQVRWDVEPLLNTPMTMLVGILLVAFAFNLATPIAALRKKKATPPRYPPVTLLNRALNPRRKAPTGISMVDRMGISPFALREGEHGPEGIGKLFLRAGVPARAAELTGRMTLSYKEVP